MNPTGTDLLDIFNSRPKRGSSPARATSRPTREPRSSGSGDGPSGRGRLLLGGTVMTLLLALAFTAGVGVGRARRVPAPTGEALARPAAPVRETWGVRSRALPALSSKADNLRNRAVSELYKKWPELDGHVFVADVLDKTGKPSPGQFRLILRDFDSRADAVSVINELGIWQVDGQMPFDGCRPERMSAK